MLRALKRIGYLKPTSIQAELIPEALDGHDVIGQAKTGTGKTAAFGIPLIEMHEARGKGPQAIILAPTRELVQQIVAELQRPGARPGRRGLRHLRRRADRAPAPGPASAASTSSSGRRAASSTIFERRSLYLGDIYHVVLDEADRMLDIGFRPDIERILRRVPNPHQTLLLSATISPDIRKLAQRYMYPAGRDEPVAGRALGRVDPAVLHHHRERSQVRPCSSTCCAATSRASASSSPGRSAGPSGSAEKLRGKVDGVATIHGDLAQTVRNRVMKNFRDGTITVLVATDVVGRGIDVNDISHVINYDIPDDAENYVHRIGRTGRMGKDGLAYMFVCPDQGEPLTAIENLINKTIQSLNLEGFESFRRRPKDGVFRELYSTALTRAPFGGR